MLKHREVNAVLMYISRTYPNFHTAKQIAHAVGLSNVRSVANMLVRCKCIKVEKTRHTNRYTLSGKYNNALHGKIRIHQNMKKAVRIMAVISNAYPKCLTSDEISKEVGLSPLEIGSRLRGVNCLECGMKSGLKTYKLMMKYED